MTRWGHGKRCRGVCVGVRCHPEAEASWGARRAGQVHILGGTTPSRPPQKSLLPRVEEKSRIRAVDGTHPGLSTKKRAGGCRDPRLRGYDTTTPLPPLQVLFGMGVCACLAGRHQSEFIRLLQLAGREVPDGLHGPAALGANIGGTRCSVGAQHLYSHHVP